MVSGPRSRVTWWLAVERLQWTFSEHGVLMVPVLPAQPPVLRAVLPPGEAGGGQRPRLPRGALRGGAPERQGGRYADPTHTPPTFICNPTTFICNPNTFICVSDQPQQTSSALICVRDQPQQPKLVCGCRWGNGWNKNALNTRPEVPVDIKHQCHIFRTIFHIMNKHIYINM